MYILKTVNILNDLVVDIFKNLMSYRISQKVKKIDIYYWYDLKKNNVKNILHNIPSHKFIIDVYTKYCNIFE